MKTYVYINVYMYLYICIYKYTYSLTRAICIYLWGHSHQKQLSRFIFNYANFPKPGILFRKSEWLKLLTRNHYKNIWRVEFVEKVMHIIQLSHILQGEVVQVFFLFKHIHWLFSCRVSSSWTPLQYLFIGSVLPLFSRKWKIDWGCECLVRMQS